MPPYRKLLPAAVFGSLVLILLQIGFMTYARPSLEKYPGHAHKAGLVMTNTSTSDEVGRPVLREFLPGGDLPTIFVSIAAFRDNETNLTLHEIFGKAKHPERIFPGVICQMDYDHPEEVCVRYSSWEKQCGEEAWCPQDNIRSRHFDSSRSRGPTFARHLAAQLYRGEDFFLMIDAHNRFEKHWDAKLISQYMMIGKKKAVLSTYPMIWRPIPDFVEDTSVAYLCALSAKNGKPLGWTSGFPGPFKANPYPTEKSKWPRPQPFIGAGLYFGPGQMVVDVPFDPHLKYLFFGEEFMLAIRLWTNGYDLYSPGVNILYHHYGRTHAPRMESHGEKYVHEMKEIAHRRIHHILGITEPGSNGTKRIVPLNTTDPAATADLPKYGLGTVRSLWQYWKFSKLDPVKQNLFTVNNTVWCGRYGPSSGPYDNHWKTHTKENDIPSDAWWSNGVAKLAVPYTNAQLN